MLFKFWFICALLELFYVATAAYIIHENLTNGTLNDQSLYVERRSERKDSRAAEDAMGDSHGGEAFTEESAVTTPEHRRIKDIYMSCNRRIDGIAFSYHDAVGGSDWPIGRPTWYGTNHGGSTERKWTLEAGEYITSIRAGLCTPAGKTERVCHLSFWTNRRQHKGVDGLKPIECGISTGQSSTPMMNRKI